MSIHRQCSRSTRVLVVGAGDAPLPGVSPPRSTSHAVSWPEGVAILLEVVMTPRGPGPAPLERRPREPTHEVEPAVEQRDRQRDPFRRRQGLKRSTIVATRFLS